MKSNCDAILGEKIAFQCRKLLYKEWNVDKAEEILTKEMFEELNSLFMGELKVGYCIIDKPMVVNND